MECATCAAKLGSPILCQSCLHNRSLISDLKAQLSRAHHRTDVLEHRIDLCYNASRMIKAVVTGKHDPLGE